MSIRETDSGLILTGPVRETDGGLMLAVETEVGNPYHDRLGRFTSKLKAVPARITVKWLNEKLSGLDDASLMMVREALVEKGSKSRLAIVEDEVKRRAGVTEPSTVRWADNEVVDASENVVDEWNGADRRSQEVVDEALARMGLDRERVLAMFDSPGLRAAGVKTKVNMEPYGDGVQVVGRMLDPENPAAPRTIGEHWGFAKFSLDPYGEAEYDYLQIKDTGKGIGKDLMYSLVTQLDAADKDADAPIKRVTLLANINVGTYAWARYGFDWELTRGQRQRIKERIERRLNEWHVDMVDVIHRYASREDQDDFQDYIVNMYDGYKTWLDSKGDDEPIHSWEVASIRAEWKPEGNEKTDAFYNTMVERFGENFMAGVTGKRLMMDGDPWQGWLQLDKESVGRRIFDAYVGAGPQRVDLAEVATARPLVEMGAFSWDMLHPRDPRTGRFVDKPDWLQRALDLIVNDNLSTADIYGFDGGVDERGYERRSYSGWRAHWHRAIAARFLSDKNGFPIEPPTGRPPRAIIGMGGPGSGKTTAINAEGVTAGSVLVAADEVRRLLPEFPSLSADHVELSGPNTHVESSQIAGYIENAAVKRKLDYFIDGTGNNSAESFRSMLAGAREGGHEVVVRYVDLPIAEAIKRVAIRALKERRSVADEVVAAKNRGSVANVPVALDEPDIDFKAFSNDVPFGTPPILIAERAPYGKLVIRRPDLWADMEERGGWTRAAG